MEHKQALRNMDELKAYIDDFRVANADYAKVNTHLNQRLDEHKKLIHSLELEVEGLRAAGCGDGRAELMKTIDSLKAANANYNKENERLQGELTQERHFLDALKHDPKDAGLGFAMGCLEDRCKILDKENAKLKSRVKGQDAEIAQLRETREELRTRINTYYGELQATKAANEKYERAPKVFWMSEEARKEFERAVVDHEVEVATKELRDANEKYENKSANMSSRLQTAESKLATAEDLVEKLKAETSFVAAAQWRDKWTEANERANGLSAALDERNIQIRNLRETLDKDRAAVYTVGKAGKFSIVTEPQDPTEKKAEMLIDAGHSVIGYVLHKLGANKIAFVVGGRCEWFAHDDWFKQMRERGDQERKIVDLESGLKSSSKEKVGLCGRIEDLKKELEESKRNYESVTAVYERTKEMLRDTCKHRDEMSEQLRRLHEELVRINEELSFQIKAKAEKRDGLEELKDKHDKACLANERMREERDSALDNLIRKQTECDGLNIKLARTEETHKELVAEITKAAKERDDALKAELRDFDQRACANLKKVCAMKDDQIARLQSEHDMFRDEFMRIRSCPGADSEIKGLCDRAVTDVERIVPLVVVAERLGKERDGLEIELEKREREVTELRCTLNHCLLLARGKENAIETRSETCRAVLDLRNERDGLRNRVHNLCASHKKIEQELNDNKEGGQAALDNTDSILETVARERDALKKALELEKTRKHAALDSVDRLFTNFKTLEKENTRLSKENEELRGLLVKPEYRPDSEIVDRYKKECEALQIRCRQYLTTIEELRVHLHKAIHDPAAEIQGLRDELDQPAANMAKIAAEELLKDINTDAFVPGLGTVRSCLGCSLPVVGGPTRCERCAKKAAPDIRETICDNSLKKPLAAERARPDHKDLPSLGARLESPHPPRHEPDGFKAASTVDPSMEGHRTGMNWCGAAGAPCPMPPSDPHFGPEEVAAYLSRSSTPANPCKEGMAT